MGEQQGKLSQHIRKNDDDNEENHYDERWWRRWGWWWWEWWWLDDDGDEDDDDGDDADDDKTNHMHFKNENQTAKTMATFEFVENNPAWVADILVTMGSCGNIQICGKHINWLRMKYF